MGKESFWCVVSVAAGFEDCELFVKGGIEFFESGECRGSFFNWKKNHFIQKRIGLPEINVKSLSC